MPDPHDQATPVVPTGNVVELRPGDKVLIGLAPGCAGSLRALQDRADQIRGRFPGVEFTFVADVTAVAVQRGDEA